MWRWAWSGASNKNHDMFIWLFVGNPFRGHLFQENVTLQTVQQQLMREQTLDWRCSCTGMELKWCRSWCFYHLSVTSEDLQWCKAANARARWAISATTGRRATTRWGDGPDRFSRVQSTQSMVNRVWWNNSMEHMNDSSIDINARQKPNMPRTSLQRFEVQTPNLPSLFFVCLFWLRHVDPICEPLKWCIVGKDGRGIGVQGLWKVRRCQKLVHFECRSTFKTTKLPWRESSGSNRLESQNVWKSHRELRTSSYKAALDKQFEADEAATEVREKKKAFYTLDPCP